MLHYIARRLLSSVIALAGMVVAVFFLARLTGNPAKVFLPTDASEEMVATFNHAHGFDQPVWVQFWRFVVDVAHLNFGESIWQQRPAIQAVMDVFPQTLLMAGVAISLATVISVTLGTIAAQHQFKLPDKMITVASLTVASIPEFWFALVAILFLAVDLGWLPTSGQSDLKSWVLPTATLMLTPVGVITQVTRGSMIEALGSGYVQSARARGYSQKRLSYRHSLRNASLPIMTVVGQRTAGLVDGAIIIGVIFAWPSIGSTLVTAVYNRDFAVIQAGVFVIGVAIILLNLLIDLTYAIADPRIRVS